MGDAVFILIQALRHAVRAGEQVALLEVADGRAQGSGHAILLQGAQSRRPVVHRDGNLQAGRVQQILAGDQAHPGLIAGRAIHDGGKALALVGFPGHDAGDLVVSARVGGDHLHDFRPLLQVCPVVGGVLGEQLLAQLDDHGVVQRALRAAGEGCPVLQDGVGQVFAGD